jgi:hypothetical protein
LGVPLFERVRHVAVVVDTDSAAIEIVVSLMGADAVAVAAVVVVVAAAAATIGTTAE